MVIKKLLAALTGILIGAGLLWGTALGAGAVRIGYLQSDLHQLAVFVALEKGFFLEEGVDVTIGGIFKAGPEEMTAFASGGLDVGYVGEAPAVVAVGNKAADVKIVGQANLEGSAIVVRKGSGIKTVKNLVGKTVAVPGYAQVQDFLLRKALAQNNIPAKSVNVIILRPPEMIPALESKQVDAFVAWEPYPAKAVSSQIGEVLLYSGKIWPNHPCCVVVAEAAYLKDNPKVIKGFLRAHVKATRFIQENPEEAVKLGVKFTGMDAETVKIGMGNIAYRYKIDRKGLLEYVNFLRTMGVIKVSDPEGFVQELVDESGLGEGPS